MEGLSAAAKNRITEALAATSYTQRGFNVKFDDENNPVAAITYSSRPECRFAINAVNDGAFETSESPGTHSDEAEIFQRSNFELCVHAVKDWVERIVERERDWILDEFGGVADRNPSLM